MIWQELRGKFVKIYNLRLVDDWAAKGYNNRQDTRAIAALVTYERTGYKWH
jgi:hypothetical protein